MALEQAAAYAANQRLSLASYLALFKERREELLALGRPLAYQGTVDATFTLAREQLQTANPAAVQLLELCALLAPDELPLPLLLGDSKLLPEPLAAAVADPLRRGEVAGALYKEGLLSQDGDDTARMHRLVQDVTLARLPEADRRNRTTDAVRLVNGLFPREAWEPDQWPQCAHLLTHSQAVVGHARTLQLTSSILAGLLHRIGQYMGSRGLDRQLVREVLEQALAMRRRLYEGDHPDVAASLNSLARDLRRLGEFEQARGLDEQAEAMRQRISRTSKQ